jgi:hypothetical protein
MFKFYFSEVFSKGLAETSSFFVSLFLSFFVSLFLGYFTPLPWLGLVKSYFGYSRMGSAFGCSIFAFDSGIG